MAAGKGRRQRRRVWRWAAAAALVVAVLLAGGLAALHLPAVQQVLVRQALAAVEARSGLRLAAESARLRPLGVRLDLVRPSLAVGAEQPFLTADSLSLEVAPLSVLRGPLVVRRVELMAPRLDGGRALPEMAPDGGGAAPLPEISVERLRLRNGAAAGMALPGAMAGLLGEVGVDGLDLDGRLVGGRLEAKLRGARVRAAPADRPPIEVAVEAELSGPVAGPLSLDGLTVSGESISATAAGLLGLAEEQPRELRVELTADVPGLLGVAADAEPARLSGRLDLQRMEGELRLEAGALPGELAAPWLPPDLFAASALAGSRLSLAGAASLAGGRLDGSLDGRWQRGERVLAEVTAVAAGERAAASPPVELELRLLPRDPGERRVEARLLLAPDSPADSRVEDGRLRLAVPDLEAELGRLTAIWPAWVPALPPGLAAGPLAIDGAFAGGRQDLTGRLSGAWRPAPGARVDLVARGAPPAGRLDASLTLSALPLRRFVEEAGGAVSGTVAVGLAGGELTGEARLEGVELGRGRPGDGRLQVTAELARGRVRLSELVAEEAGRGLWAAGEIELPAQAADLALKLIGDWAPISSAEGRLRLAGGRLLLDVPRAEVAGEAASLSATVPLATLARLPGAAALDGLPLELAEGPLQVEWRLPALDWVAVLGAAAIDRAPAVDRLRAGSHGRLSLDPLSPATASGELAVVDLALAQGDRRLEAAGPLAVTVAAGRLELAPLSLSVDGQRVEVSGEARLAADWSPGEPPMELLEGARILAITAGRPPIETAEVALQLREGRMELALAAPLSGGGEGRLEATAPLASLMGQDAGPLEATFDLPAADWSGWLGDGAEEDRALTALVAGVGGRVLLDLRRPAQAAAELRLPVFEARLGEQSLRAREPIELRLADGRLEVVAARLLAADAPLELTGHVDLEPAWTPDRPAVELLRELMLKGGGVLPAALLSPFLEGGVGEGALLAELAIAGRRESAAGELRLAGESAGFYFVSPYALEITAPELTVRLDGGAATFAGAARVNEGRLRFDGEAGPETGLRLSARLEEVRAVLDYGLLTLLDADLRLAVEPQGAGLLSGTLTVDSGQLTRPIRLESLLLDQLLPADLLSSELDPLESIALDLRLETRQGVRVKNNLADLKVRWQPVAVRGNLVRPIVEGRLEVDPGGLVHAYGQTLRLDSAALVYRGLPDEVPTLEARITTSFEDPTIGRLAGDDPFAPERLRPRPAADGDEAPGARAVAGEALTTGLAAFLGEQLSGSVGEALGGTRISFRPLPVFGEADPGARLTASRDLSARATVAASVDLRNAERQTYLLDLHDEEAAARLSAQLFTNDQGNQGATLQQRFQFGGSQRRVEGPRLRRLFFDRVPGVRRRALRRASGYRRGDRLPEGAAFEISVAVGELLRDRGYPDARVRVESRPARRRSGVELAVRIESGPRVEFRFTGESLPRPLRRAVAQLYRGDFYEPKAMEEMRLEATRAWRSRGHLDPRVDVRREVVAGGPPERRRVTVDSAPGERLDLGPPRFTGLPADEAAELSALFGTPLRRTELAAGLPATEQRALDGLAALGYPDAALAGRRLSPDGRLLTVEVEPGDQLRIAVLEIVDSRGLRTEVGEAGGLRAGDPVRADRLSRAALEVESELRDAGYLDAEVRLAVEPLGDARPAERRAVFHLDRGPRYRLGETAFAGLGSARPSWARRTAGLTVGETLAPAALREARRRLFGTGLFSAVGSAVDGAEEGAVRVLFEVEEEPRYRVAYGMRWESEEGTSVVVDLLDRNFSGRGVDIGMRALWSEEVQQLRLSGSMPGVLGPKSRLELFALAEDEERLVEEGEVRDNTRTLEGTVQLGWQLGRRSTGRVYARYGDVDFTKTFLVEDPIFGPIDPIEVRVKRPFLGLQYIFDSRDDRVAPGRGLFASVDLSYSDESLGGDIRYGRLFGQLHSYRPAGRLGGRRLTWAQSVRLGRAEAFSGQELLGDLLLLAGGEYSVRGYRRESLGPPELTGRVLPSVEENSLFVLNEELRFDIWSPLSGLLFLDAGNVWIDNDIDFDLFTSLGLGLRADTPLGLLRLDVAWPLDRRQGIDPEVKVYFGLGNVF